MRFIVPFSGQAKPYMLQRLQRKLLQYLAHVLPPHCIESSIKSAIAACIQKLEASDGLRFLFHLDEFIYMLEGQKSIEYDHGIHTKHRHTRYHDFFTSRIRPGEHVLDVGCGIGALTYDMAHKSLGYVHGVDISRENICIALKKYPHENICYIHADIMQYTPDRHFDVVTLSNVLEHLPDRSSFLRMLKDKIAPLRFLIRVPLFERDWRVPLRKELGEEWRLDSTHEIEYTLESFSQEIREAGLEISYQEIRWGEIWAEIIASRDGIF